MTNTINFFPNEEENQIYIFFAEQLWIEEYEENKEMIKDFLDWAYKDEYKNKGEKSLFDKLKNNITKYDFINDILYNKLKENYRDCELYKEWGKIFTDMRKKSRKTFIVEYLRTKWPADFDELWYEAKQKLKLSKNSEAWFKRIIEQLKNEWVIVKEHDKFNVTNKDEKYLKCKKISIFYEELESDNKQKTFFRIKKMNNKDFENLKLSTDIFDDLWELLINFKQNNDFSSEEVFNFLLKIYITT